MKNGLIFMVLLCIDFACFSQKLENEKVKINQFFTQFDVAIPIVGNPNSNLDYVDGVKNTNKNWFIPDGLQAKFGYGIQKNRWLGLSVHTGIDWKATEKLVAIPVYGNLRISPALTPESRITLQLGYGKGFALGRGNLSGNYKKISLGIETDEDLIVFVEIADYAIKVNQFNSVSSIALGLAFRAF